MVSQWVAALTQPIADIGGQLGAKSQRVDNVAEIVRLAVGHIPVVLEVMNVHVAIAKRASRGKMEVSDDLVNLEGSVNAAALVALLFQSLGVMFALTLLKGSAITKGPGLLSICFSNFLASIAASLLHNVARSGGATTFTTVRGVEMLSTVVMEVQGRRFDNTATFGFRSEAHLVNTVGDAMLLLARHVHDIEGKKLTGHLRETDVEMNIHAFT